MSHSVGLLWLNTPKLHGLSEVSLSLFVQESSEYGFLERSLVHLVSS